MKEFEIVTLTNVNIRSNAGNAFDIIDKIPAGSRTVVREIKRDGGGTAWYRLDKGWVNSKFVKLPNQVKMANGAGVGMSLGIMDSISSYVTGAVSSASSILGTTGISGTTIAGLSGVDSGGSQSTLLTRRIFGGPHQFIDTTDMRPSDGPLGVQFTTNIMAETPILSIMPGLPDYLPDLNSEERIKKTGALVDGMNEASEKTANIAKSVLDAETEDIRFFDFSPAVGEYLLYANFLCRMCAMYIGIGDKQVPGAPPGPNSTYSKFNWFNWHLSNAYNQQSTAPNIKTSFDVIKSQFESLFSSKNGGQVTDGYDALQGSMNQIDLNTNSLAYADSYFMEFFIKPPQFSDSFSNSTDTSALASGLQSASGMAKEFNFLLGASGAEFGKNAEESMSNMMDYLKAQNTAGGAMNDFVKRLIGGSQSIIKGGNLIFPEIWSSSSYDRDFQVSINLSTPYGDPESIFLNIMVPYMFLLALVLPRQMSVNAYTSPFIVRATVPGFFYCNMGIIKSMSIERGGDGTAWSVQGLPTEVNITLSISDLYNALSMSKFSNMKNIYNALYNTQLFDFIGVQCGANLRSSDLLKKLSFIKSMTENQAADNINSTAITTLSNMAVSKARIMASKG